MQLYNKLSAEERAKLIDESGEDRLTISFYQYHQIKNTEIVEELELPPVKIHCSVLAEDAIKAAINDLKSKAN
mgnify:CR=1 FL=1